MSWKRGKEHQQWSQQKRDADLNPNYQGVRQGGGGSYDPNEMEKRRERASIMARNNNPETEAMNEDSTAAVMALLGNKDLFPWIEEVELEEDRLGDDDWQRKTDAYVRLNPRLCSLGLLDQYRIQIKSGWSDFTGLKASEIKKLLYLTHREWQVLGLVVLFGQATNESVVASFCLQVINHMKIAGVKNAREVFLAFQTQEVLTMLTRFEAMDIGGRDWEKLLYWIATGLVKREEFGQAGNKVVFIS